MRKPATLLLTRPVDRSARFAELCRARFGGGLRIVIAPLMQIRPVTTDLNAENYAGLIFTSEGAVTLARSLWPDLDVPAYVVGGRTAAGADAVGFRISEVADNGDELFETLVSIKPQTPLLHLRGVYSAGALAEQLSKAGIATDEAVIYDQIPLDLSGEAVNLVKGEAPVVLPLFSPRSATIFWQDRVTRAPISVVAMSRAVAEACGEKPDRVFVAERPNAKAMLDGVARALGADPVEGRRGAG